MPADSANPIPVYFISGLGADERIFKNLVIPPEFAVRHIPWLEPFPEESLENYCLRLAAQIDPASEFMLVGLSFGGIVAVEMNRFLKPKQTILISSIVTRNGFSPLLRASDKFRLHQVVPAWLFKHFRYGAYWFFNAKSREEKELLASFMANASANLMKWSIDKVVSWKNRSRPENVYLIHGDADRVFPHERSHADSTVKGGGHLMVYNKAGIISKILTERLRK